MARICAKSDDKSGDRYNRDQLLMPQKEELLRVMSILEHTGTCSVTLGRQETTRHRLPAG